MRRHALAAVMLVAALSIGADAGPPKLRSGLTNPFPGGTMAGYAGDTGLDISGFKKPVFALVSGTVDYSEYGHTLWRGPKDTAFCIRVTLDKPIPFSSGRVSGKITHVYYAHLSALEFTQAEHAETPRHVSAGEKLGTSGIANGSPHLHVGLLLDGQVEQDDWVYFDRRRGAQSPRRLQTRRAHLAGRLRVARLRTRRAHAPKLAPPIPPHFFSAS